MCWWLCPLSLSLSLSVAVCPSLSRFGRALLPFIFMFARCLGPPKNDDMKNCVARFWALLSDSVSLGVFFGGFRGFSGVFQGVFGGSGDPHTAKLLGCGPKASQQTARKLFERNLWLFKSKEIQCLFKKNERTVRPKTNFEIYVYPRSAYFVLRPCSIYYFFVCSLSFSSAKDV